MPRARSLLRIRMWPALAILPFAPPALAAAEPAAAPPENSCVDCHRDPDFIVTNNKLYDYYQQWSGSIHEQEGVTCDECHGGNARSADADAAHADGVRSSDPASGIYFENVPETCGRCHEGVLAGFRESSHFEHVEEDPGEEQGPTCVTCHGSVDSAVLNVNTVVAACARCHNEESDNHPEHPGKAREVLNRFLSIQRFYRYITIRAEPEEAQVFFADLEPRLAKLAVTWHTFDLDAIEAETAAVLARMKAKREEIRARRRAERAAGAAEGPR